MFRTTQLAQQLESPTSPGLVAGKTQPPEDQAIDFLSEQKFRQRELRLLAEHRHGFIADAQQRASRNRFLVILDLLFDEQFVLVFERTCWSIGHSLGVAAREQNLGWPESYASAKRTLAHAGSTWTVMSAGPYVDATASSTRSASACATSTGVVPGTAIISSAKSTPEAV